MSETTLDPIGLRAAEARLRDHLARQLKAPWFAGARHALDREDRRPVIRVYAASGRLPDALAWVASRGGEWDGFRLSASQHTGG